MASVPIHDRARGDATTLCEIAALCLGLTAHVGAHSTGHGVADHHLRRLLLLALLHLLLALLHLLLLLEHLQERAELLHVHARHARRAALATVEQATQHAHQTALLGRACGLGHLTTHATLLEHLPEAEAYPTATCHFACHDNPLELYPSPANPLIKPTAHTGRPVCAICKHYHAVAWTVWFSVQHIELQASWLVNRPGDALQLVVQPLRCNALAWECWDVVHR